jgi:hypothetical protein
MKTLDQRITLKPLYSVKATVPVLVDVPELTVLAFDGVGDPAVSDDYRTAIESLMALAWGIRAHRKAQESSVEIRVMPLEGQWALPPGMTFSDEAEVRAQSIWSMQIVQPSDFSEVELADVRANVAKKKRDLIRLDEVRIERLPPTRAATLLHIGPYTEETATIARIHEAIQAAGGEPADGHREIYLSDPRRVAPEKLKTILRVAFRS